jgi:threonine dehydrogenase-like Zn-dependent dehydrogenase
MLALQFQNTESVEVKGHAVPLISHPQDAIVRITTNTICGSDLHLYQNKLPVSGQLRAGDILGHEGVGIVEEVGQGVKSFKPGDRVAIAFCIACGDCEFCRAQKFTLCDRTNSSKLMEDLYGQRLAGIFGYSHLLGGYAGLQAEYARVPLADNCLLKLPDSVRNEQAIFLSDVMCTGWHANELGEVTKGKTVAIWGCGPIGLAAAYLARYRGASKVISIDCVPDRLALAQKYANADVINFEKTHDVVAEIFKLVPGGVDVGIEAAGYRYAKTTTQKMLHSTMGLDQTDISSEMFKAVKKGGNISYIGDYFSFANSFPTGMLMEKWITTRGSQAPPQKYWRYLLQKIEAKELDLSWLVSEIGKFEDIAELYKQFDAKKQLKVVLLTKFGRDREGIQEPLAQGQQVKGKEQKSETSLFASIRARVKELAQLAEEQLRKETGEPREQGQEQGGSSRGGQSVIDKAAQGVSETFGVGQGPRDAQAAVKQQLQAQQMQSPQQQAQGSQAPIGWLGKHEPVQQHFKPGAHGEQSTPYQEQGEQSSSPWRTPQSQSQSQSQSQYQPAQQQQQQHEQQQQKRQEKPVSLQQGYDERSQAEKEKTSGRSWER